MSGPACACLHVVYYPIYHGDGAKTERWTCKDCGTAFSRHSRIVALEAELVAAGNYLALMRTIYVNTSDRERAAELLAEYDAARATPKAPVEPSGNSGELPTGALGEEPKVIESLRHYLRAWNHLGAFQMTFTLTDKQVEELAAYLDSRRAAEPSDYDEAWVTSLPDGHWLKIWVHQTNEIIRIMNWEFMSSPVAPQVLKLRGHCDQLLTERDTLRAELESLSDRICEAGGAFDAQGCGSLLCRVPSANEQGRCSVGVAVAQEAREGAALMLKTECAVCGSKLEYLSEAATFTATAADEQDALTKWLAAHEVCRLRTEPKK